MGSSNDCTVRAAQSKVVGMISQNQVVPSLYREFLRKTGNSLTRLGVPDGI